MECINEIFPILLYTLGAVLLVFLIVLTVRMIKTLNRVDYLLEDVNRKSSKIDGVFDIIDNATDAISHVSDLATNYLMTKIKKVFDRKGE